jgi:ABC-type phosphate transport system substrate-binding protein
MKIFRCLAAAALGLTVALSAQAGSVIVSADSPESSMDEAKVQSLFLGRETKVGGTAVALVFQKPGAAREKFDADVLGKPGAQLTAHWSRLIFTGRAKQPEEAGSDAEVVAKVAGKPGAIGYVSAVPAGAAVKVVYEF